MLGQKDFEMCKRTIVDVEESAAGADYTGITEQDRLPSACSEHDTLGEAAASPASEAKISVYHDDVI
jgi:hypothetical protein